MKKKILALGIAVIVGCAQIMTVSASKQNQLENQQQKKAETRAALNSVDSEINALEDKKNAITNEISELDGQLVVTMAAVESLKNDIVNKQAEIEVTEANLAAAKEDQEEQYELMKKRIQFLYENGGEGAWLSLLLDGKDIASILNQAEYTQKLYDYDRQCLEEYMAVVQQVTDYSEQLADEKAELEASEAEQEAQQASLEEMLAQKRATSADYDAQLDEMEQKAAEYKALIDEQNQKIQQLQREIQEEEEARRRAEEEAARQAEAAAQAERERQEEAARQEAAAQANRNNSSSGSNTSGGSSSGSSSSNSGSSGSSSSGNSSSSSSSGSSSSSSGSATGSAIADYACNFVGNPYVWGGTSLTNGADCSGFIMSVYAHFGYSLPHSSAAMRSYGRGVSYSEAQPGDIICYDGHVAIYIGGGAIVHASNERDGIKISGNAAYRTILAVRRIV